METLINNYMIAKWIVIILIALIPVTLGYIGKLLDKISYYKKILEEIEREQESDSKNGNCTIFDVSGSLPTNKDELKNVCCEFFRYWWNEPGNNTDEGFDKWWSKRQ